MAKTFIEAIGYRLGRKAAQAKSAFDLMGGTEQESLRAEIRLGRDLAAALVQRTPLVVDSQKTRFAAQICDWLGAYVQEKQLSFCIYVTAERELNAFALPGGPIFASWSLLAACGGQRDELAFVLAHEMGHIVRRHTLERIIKDAAVTLLLRQVSGRSAAAAWLNKVGKQALGAAFSKENELEADRFARDLIQSAGGDPLAAVRLLEKLSTGSFAPGLGPAESYLAMHPPVQERIANLRAAPAR